MDLSNLSNRIEKFNREHYVSNHDSQKFLSKKLLNAREKNNLQLRKNKLDDDIMKNRMINLFINNQNKQNEYSHLIISYNELEMYLPQDFNQEFDNYDDKLDKIKEYLQIYTKHLHSQQIIDENSLIQIEVYMKYAIMRLRLELEVFENINDEGFDLDCEILDNIIKILLSTRDLKLKVKLLLKFLLLVRNNSHFNKHYL